MKSWKKRFKFIFLFLAGLFLLLSPKLIKIKQINCHSQYGVCGEVVTKDLESIEKEDVIKTKKRIEDKLKSEFLIRDYQVYFKIPSTLDVDVIEKKPKFNLASSGDEGKWALVDKDGFVLTTSDTNNLPGVVSDDNLPQVGQTVSDKNLFAMNVMYDMFSLYHIQRGKMTTDGLVIEFPDSLRVIFPLEGDRQELVGEIILLYNELESKKEVQEPGIQMDIKEIDLRFKNPIIR